MRSAAMADFCAAVDKREFLPKETAAKYEESLGEYDPRA